MYDKTKKADKEQQDRPNIFEERKYIRSFSNRDFSKNLIVSDNVSVDLNNVNDMYAGSNCLIGDIETINHAFIAPNIVQMNTSYIIKDYDGEMLSTYGDMLKIKGYDVKVINYMNTKQSLKYNLFKYINYEDDVENVVSMITNSNEIGLSKGQKLLKNAENLLLEAIIYYILLELPHEEHSLATVQRMLKLAQPKGDVKDEYDSDLKMLFVVLENEQKNDSIALERYKQFLLASKHMEHVIIKNVQQYLAIYNMNSIKRIINDDTLKIEDLFEKEKVAIFIVVPSNNNNYEHMADMFITQLITHIQYVAEQKYYSKLPYKLHIITHSLIHSDIIGLIKNIQKYNMVLTVGVSSIETWMAYYENVYDVIDSFSLVIAYDYKDENIKEYVKFRIYEENRDVLQEDSFELEEYIDEEDENIYIVLFKYAKPIIGYPYNLENNENYMECSEQSKECNMSLLKDEIKHQIYRNLISQIEENQNTVRIKENVNVDIGSKRLVPDEVYENISIKVNKSLVNDV